MSWLPVVFFLCLTACSSTRTAYPDAGKSKDAARYTESSVPDTPPAPDRESAKDEGPDTDTVVESPAHRECKLTFSYDTLGEAVESLTLPGEFNGWNAEAQGFDDEDGDGIYETHLDTASMAPGSYAYKLYLNGEWMLDPAQRMRKHVDGIENSKVIVPNCLVPWLELESLTVDGGSIEVVVAVQDGKNATGLFADSAAVRHGFESLEDTGYNALSQRFVVKLKELPAGKHTLTFEIANEVGQAVPLYLPVWVEESPFEWRDAVMYFAMTDRFFDGDPSVGEPSGCLDPNSPANWLGGDWAGVQQKIEEDYFSKLGVTALWLTAFADNPDGCFVGSLEKLYTSYHGYFPISQTAPENQLGSMEDLKAMVAAAHKKGIRVMMDLVTNHTHEKHPLYTEHKDDGWFHPYYQCGFDEAPLSCWFEPYMPDLDYQNDAPVEAMTEMALWWIREVDLDGFRLDAVKHMHDNFLRTLRVKIEQQIESVPGSRFYMVGETFVGDWGGGQGDSETTIKHYIAPWGLHGQFDFPLYWRLLRTFARSEEGMGHVADYLSDSQGYWGTGSVMGNFLGNHDVPRFVSHAAGDIPNLWGVGAKEIGWTNPPGQPQNAEPYERLKLAFSLLFTSSGVPLIYYGDEVGLAGAGDPDNRRMMVFDGLSEAQSLVYQHVSKLAQVRRNQNALRRGSYETLQAGDSLLAYSKKSGSEEVLVVLNRSDKAQTAVLNRSGSWTDALSGNEYSAGPDQLLVEVPAFGTRILSQ
jgi:glycosidase